MTASAAAPVRVPAGSLRPGDRFTVGRYAVQALTVSKPFRRGRFVPPEVTVLVRDGEDATVETFHVALGAEQVLAVTR